MNNEHAGSDCSEGCAGFKSLPGIPWNNYGICKRPASPNHGFPTLRGRPCRSYFPSFAAPVKPPLTPDDGKTRNASH